MLVLTAGPQLARGTETVVISCGPVLERKAVLGGDLDCSAHSGDYALVLQRGTTLRLAGYTLTANASGIYCDHCRIKGPGTITRSVPAFTPPDSCTGVTGVASYRSRVSDVTFTNFGWAVNSSISARVKRITVTDSCFGVVAGTSASVFDSIITDNAGWGVRTLGRMRVVRSTITGQPRDLWSPTPPRVHYTTCVTSSEDGTPGIDFWDVCGP